MAGVNATMPTAAAAATPVVDMSLLPGFVGPTQLANLPAAFMPAMQWYITTNPQPDMRAWSPPQLISWVGNLLADYSASGAAPGGNGTVPFSFPGNILDTSEFLGEDSVWYTFFVLFIVFWVVGSALTVLRRHREPVKSRGWEIVLVQGAFMASRMIIGVSVSSFVELHGALAARMVVVGEVHRLEPPPPPFSSFCRRLRGAAKAIFRAC